MSGGGLRRVAATRYVSALREGGSLPGLMEADDDGLYVVKFRGAGQGPKALVAELVAGEVGRRLGLPVPEIVLVELDPALAAAEPDPEIQDLLRASPGLNLGLDYLPGSLAYDPAAGVAVEAELAASVVWFDALMTNVDRTPRNPNLLMWHGAPWLIDHGAALYLHHGGGDLPAKARRPFPAIADHVLLPVAGAVGDADACLAPLLPRAALDAVLALVPDGWLEEDPAGRRRQYGDYLERRLAAPRTFAEEAEAARRAA